jgi:hypothetical protein
MCNREYGTPFGNTEEGAFYWYLTIFSEAGPKTLCRGSLTYQKMTHFRKPAMHFLQYCLCGKFNKQSTIEGGMPYGI